MVHRSFVGKRVQKSEEVASTESVPYKRHPNPAARNYALEMAPVNGEHILMEEHIDEARRRRQQFQDEVSKRMGDLLLRGWTMLDGYCQHCNGILMEKSEERKCLQCEVYQESQQVEQPKKILEIPLEAYIEEDDEPSVIASAQVPKPVVSSQFVQKPETQETQKRAVPEQKSCVVSGNASVGSFTSVTANQTSFPGEATAVAALDRKLAWAASALDETQDVTTARELAAFIHEAIKALKNYRS